MQSQRDHTSPRSISSHDANAEDRLLLREQTERVLNRLQKLLNGEGKSWLIVSSYWQGELRWARNRASMTSDRRNIQAFVFREIRGGKGTAMTNQIDDASLEGVVQSAERQALEQADQRALDVALEPPVFTAMKTTSWSDETLDRTVEESATFVQDVTGQAETQDLLSAGYLESRGFSLGQLWIDNYGRVRPMYGQMTQAQCSVTVRHPKGTGSGWAGLCSYDLAKVDEGAIAKRALDKCLASLDPVRIEPGRYTVILEPQAVAELVQIIIEGETGPMFRSLAEDRVRQSPFFLNYDAAVSRDRSKLGLKVVDERITISHDPSDPETGILPVPGIKPITWIKDGVLQTMTYDRHYALNELNENDAAERRGGFRMTGGTTSIEEMIATTKRGLLVTRFSGLRVLDATSLLTTGTTRDGLWLIENGKIAKAVRNFRFTESPLFVLNNVVELGVPVPTFSPFDFPEHAGFFPSHALSQVIVPPIKANDFSFTSTIDAV